MSGIEPAIVPNNVPKPTSAVMRNGADAGSDRFCLPISGGIESWAELCEGNAIDSAKNEANKAKTTISRLKFEVISEYGEHG